MRRHIILFGFCLVALVACAARGEIGFVAQNAPGPDAAIERIFVATTRQRRDMAYDFSGLRTPRVSYARFDISIPPQHQIGKIEWPKSTPDPDKNFVTTDAVIYDKPSGFRADLGRSIQSRPSKNEVVVFIHGYNNNFAESLYRLAQISTDMEFRGTPVLYAWPTTEHSIEYLHDRDSALFARDGLQTLLEQLARSGAKRLILVAHSIGANLLMETLRQMSIGGDKAMSRIINGVVLISPDIDQNLFQLQLSRLNPVPDPLIVFSTENDRALKLMSFLTGRQSRLGQITSSAGLGKYGVQVINLSNFDDGDGLLNHTVALTSPSVIAIIKKLPALGELATDGRGNPNTRLQRLFKKLPNK